MLIGSEIGTSNMRVHMAELTKNEQERARLLGIRNRTEAQNAELKRLNEKTQALRKAIRSPKKRI